MVVRQATEEEEATAVVADVVAADAAAVVVIDLPFLGAGLGYRTPLRSGIYQHRNELPVLEIIADDYLDPTGEQRDELDLLAAHFVLLPHALGLSLGSAEGIDGKYLDQLTALIERLHPPWWSEHIAFTRAGGFDIGHLTPLPFTQEAVGTLAMNVAQVRRSISAPLILENSAATFTLPGEMDEPAFLSAVIAATHCGLLLDVTNLQVNAGNQGFCALTALHRLPLDHVVQLHFTGGHRRVDLEIDSHAYPTPEPVWTLMAEVCHRAPVRAAILERDQRLPPINELLDEVRRAKSLMHGRPA
jgi:uncharacterized protein